MRADARRNAELLVATAKVVFAEKGPTAPLDEIARRAGVGPGTLYRHFPNRNALIQAVYRVDMEELAGLAHALLATMPPGPALDAWMHRYASFVRYKRGLAESLGAAPVLDDETATRCRRALFEGADALLDAAKRAGEVRADIRSDDLLLLLRALGIATEGGTEEDSDRMLSIMLAGLRPAPAPVP
jgi:AcrR family transcriptional regulator